MVCWAAGVVKLWGLWADKATIVVTTKVLKVTCRMMVLGNWSIQQAGVQYQGSRSAEAIAARDGHRTSREELEIRFRLALLYAESVQRAKPILSEVVRWPGSIPSGQIGRAHV